MKKQIVNVFSLTGEHFPKCPLYSLDSISYLVCVFLPLLGRGQRDYLQRVADVVIHHPYHFQFPDKVVPLPSLVKKDEEANPDTDESVIHHCDRQAACVLLQPDIRQTSKKEDAKPSKNAPQSSNPIRTCSGGNHGRHFATIGCYWPRQNITDLQVNE